MRAALIVGAALTFAIGGLHSVLGERYILARLLRRQDLPRLFGGDWFTRRTLRFAWHLTTVAWWGLATVMLVFAAQEATAAISGGLQAIAATFLISAVLAAGASRGKHLSWPVFLAIAIACWSAAS